MPVELDYVDVIVYSVKRVRTAKPDSYWVCWELRQLFALLLAFLTHCKYGESKLNAFC